MRDKIFLLFIVFIAFLLRFYQVGSNPPSLAWDEAAWGYNAYTLGIDGKDEFGRYLPLDYFESFGDFKPPVYAYLTVIPVWIFGLNEFAVRFPSALFGSLTVLLTYFLVKKIFSKKLKDDFLIPHKVKMQEFIALSSALILAVSPWHTNLSRAAFEANVASFFIVLGVLFFLIGIQKKLIFLVLSVAAFILSVYTFNSARIVSPLLFLFLLLGFWRELRGQIKHLFIAGVIGAILLHPTLPFLLTPQASLRFKEVNIFSDIDVIKRVNQEVQNDNNELWSKIIHNRRLTYSVEYVRHYFDHFNPLFLFIRGDGNPKFSTQSVGQLYLWDMPFLILGILYLIRKKEGYWWILPVWIFIGIIPAATARETPHALRIETTLPAFQILIAYGLAQFLQKILSVKSKIFIINYRNLVMGGVIVLFLFNVAYYLHDYHKHYPWIYSGEWQYGYKEAVDYAKSMEGSYDTIYMTHKLGRPYIYYAFYTKVNPKIFRKSMRVKRDPFGFVTINGFEKYRFSNDLIAVRNPNKKQLFIDTPTNIPDKTEIVKRFYLLNGEQVLVAYRF